MTKLTAFLSIYGMKAKYSIMFLLFTVSISKAQFVFTSININPNVGEKDIEYNADTTNVNFGLSGPNQIWDFSALIINTNLYITHSFVTPIAHLSCWANRFPTATVEDSISQAYYRTSDTSISLLGYNPYATVYSNDTQFVFPFTYGSTFQNFSGNTSNCGSPTGGAYQLNKTYDGFGTLILPGLTYYNVARTCDLVHFSYNYGLGSLSKGYSYTYKWYSDSIKFPLLTFTIETDSSFQSYPGPGIWIANPIKKTILVNGVNRVGINSLTFNNNNFVVYPNPSSELAVIKFNNTLKENCTLIVSTMQGQVVRTITNITQEKVEIERQNLVSGLYYFQLRTDKRVVATGKLIIE